MHGHVVSVVKTHYSNQWKLWCIEMTSYMMPYMLATLMTSL